MLGRVGAGVVRRGEGTLASPSAVELASTSLGLSQVSSPSVGAREAERGREGLYDRSPRLSVRLGSYCNECLAGEGCRTFLKHASKSLYSIFADALPCFLR